MNLLSQDIHEPALLPIEDTCLEARIKSFRGAETRSWTSVVQLWGGWQCCSCPQVQKSLWFRSLLLLPLAKPEAWVGTPRPRRWCAGSSSWTWTRSRATALRCAARCPSLCSTSWTTFSSRCSFLSPSELARLSVSGSWPSGCTYWREFSVQLQLFRIDSVQFSRLVVSDCDPVDCSMPGLPVHHQLPELNSCPLIWWCHPTISSTVVHSSSRLHSFPASGSFQMSRFFASGGQSIGVSASASVLPMNIQDWFPLE